VKFSALVYEVPSEISGCNRTFATGNRYGVRFQRHVDAWVRSYWDVVVDEVASSDGGITAVLRFNSNHDSESKIKFAETGELFELLDGFIVVAVGRVRTPVDSEADGAIEVDEVVSEKLPGEPE
jgi:hypothetical protein